jgi:hypothetical protein
MDLQASNTDLAELEYTSVFKLFTDEDKTLKILELKGVWSFHSDIYQHSSDMNAILWNCSP